VRLISSTLFLVLAVAGCSRDGRPTTPIAAASDVAPLPPASGTPVGYLLDNSSSLKLTGDQYEKLRQIDASLSAKNDTIDTQLREIEKPEEEPPPDKNAPPPVRPPNMAPGAAPMRTTDDASKLHEARAAQNTEALEKAFALLDASQQLEARKLLAARGIASPKPTATAEPRQPATTVSP
jgi:hypothetical protein